MITRPKNSLKKDLHFLEDTSSSWYCLCVIFLSSVPLIIFLSIKKS